MKYVYLVVHERGRIDKAFCNEREARKRAQELNNKFNCFEFYYRKIELITKNNDDCLLYHARINKYLLNKNCCLDSNLLKEVFSLGLALGKNSEEIGNDLAIRWNELKKELDEINKREN